MKRFGKARRNKVISASIIIVILFLICTSIGLLPFSHAMESKSKGPRADFKQVLILNSYDEEYKWTSSQSNAITKKLKEEFDNVLIFVEYMDMKYHPDVNNLELLYEMFQYKYSDRKLDLVFTTDNAALEFAVAHREDLFSNAAIVYSGVTKKAAAEILKDAENVVGVYEVLNPAETIRAASHINTELEKIYVIFDNSQSGLDSQKLIVEGLTDTKYKLVFLNMLSIDSLLEKISTLDKNSVILMGAYSADANGFRIPADKFAELISKASSVPVYDMMDYRLGHGILGGCLLSGSETGKASAELGVKILRGSSADLLDTVEKTPTAHTYDYEQLQRFRIPMDRLPEECNIINKPFSFFETYKHLVICTVVAFAVLLAFILILLRLIKKRKKAENAAYEANEELKALYEQLYAIDQQLKHQLNELSGAHENLRLSEEKYRLVAEASNDIIWDWNSENRLVYYSSGLKAILGYETTELMNQGAWYQVILAEDKEIFKKEIEKSVEWKQDLSTIEYRVRHKNGDILWISTKAKMLYNESGKPYKIVGSHTDITKLKEYQNRILEMAYYDELTNLPNRAYLKEYINKQIRSGTGATSALLYIDIDDFKSINDNFGHNEGDRLLVEIGKILKDITGEDDLVFRQGGDEFVIVFNHIQNRDEIMEYVAKLKDRLADPVRLSQGEFHITLSGGIVVYPEDGDDYDTLLKNADIAMYFVKNNGKNQLMFFNMDMIEGAIEKLILDHRLRAAVKNMDFSLHYQPIADIRTGKITKFEALIRWRDPEVGQVPPSVFIHRAEETGLIIPIGNWVLRESCIFAANLASKGYSDVSVSINISPIQLKQKDFVPNIMEIISETGVEADRIELEITESILIDSLETSLKTLHEVKSMGISISLDDFGQGYSSLTYLRMLPINTLKIDKSFLDNYTDADRTGQIICTIIELAHGMHIAVVAEGVETKEQFGFLNEIHCDLVQGYFISKPVHESEAFNLLINR